MGFVQSLRRLLGLEKTQEAKTKKAAAPPREQDTQPHNPLPTLRGVLWWGIVGILFVLLYSLNFAFVDASRILLFEPISVLATSALLSCACLSVGGLLGFLFAVPRTVQSDTNSPQGATSNSAQDTEYSQRVNTNLEQISDWLTKIIVGVGLTQLMNIPDKVLALGEFLKPALGGNIVFPVALVVNFSICGFFAGYLITRLYLAGQFADADKRLLSRLQRIAKDLSAQGEYNEAIRQYELALRALTTSTPKADRQSVYEGLVFNYLYEYQKQGFRKAIEYGRQFTEEAPTSSYRIWVYLAAAYGQFASWTREREGGEELFEQAKADALSAANSAIAINPAARNLLAAMYYPDHPGKFPGDDDLQVFHPDPGFDKLLGQG